MAEVVRRASGSVMPRGAIILAVLLQLSCELESLPPAPSEVTSGLTIYEHANYLGESAHLTRSIEDLRDFKGPCEHAEDDTYVSDWNDCVSSIRLAPGWRAVAYRNPGYDGDSLEIRSDQPNLQLARGDCPHDGMNDCISSIRLTPP